MIGNLKALLTIAEPASRDEVQREIGSIVEKTASLGIRSIGLRGGRIDDLLATGLSNTRARRADMNSAGAVF